MDNSKEPKRDPEPNEVATLWFSIARITGGKDSGKTRGSNRPNDSATQGATGTYDTKEIQTTPENQSSWPCVGPTGPSYTVPCPGCTCNTNSDYPTYNKTALSGATSGTRLGLTDVTRSGSQSSGNDQQVLHPNVTGASVSPTEEGSSEILDPFESTPESKSSVQETKSQSYPGLQVQESPENHRPSRASPDEKPRHSYIGLISMAILASAERRLVLADIYQYIMDHFPHYDNGERAWRNSVRHNLSLNGCFVKAGRAENGKGNYWAIHPACLRDFARGDYRRRHARRRTRNAAYSDLLTPSSPQQGGLYSGGYSPYPALTYQAQQVQLAQHLQNPSRTQSLCCSGLQAYPLHTVHPALHPAGPYTPRFPLVDYDTWRLYPLLPATWHRDGSGTGQQCFNIQ